MVNLHILHKFHIFPEICLFFKLLCKLIRCPDPVSPSPVVSTRNTTAFYLNKKYSYVDSDYFFIVERVLFRNENLRVNSAFVFCSLVASFVTRRQRERERDELIKSKQIDLNES